MPMVPTFQNGLPQVQDSGRSGFSPITPPQDRMDYASVMQKALAPVNEWANSAVKALEVQRARVIKAESDDAEREVMSAIDAHLNNPETGYLTKMGRNAMDDYQPAMEAMTRDVNAIVGKLSPQAREAVQSRVYDRMQSAQSQAQRWNASQTRHYQMQSSSSKVEALQADAANHYADPDYLAKSAASVDMELDYQAQLMGWDAETLANQKRAHMDQLQANRFSAWAQDDPLSALEAFQNTPDGAMSTDIKGKVGNALWSSAKSQLSLMVADKLGDTMLSKRDFVKQAMRGNFRSGIPVVDRLSKNQKIDLFTQAFSMAAQRRSEQRGSLTREVQNSLATVASTGADENELTEGQFVEVYGDKEGKERYANYKIDFDTSKATYAYQMMPVDLIEEDIRASRPAPGDPDYAEKMKGHNARVKAAGEIVKARKTDPMGAAILTGQYGVKPLNFGDLNSVGEELRHRVSVAGDLSSDWRVPQTLFSASEAKMLVGALEKANVDEQCEMLSVISNAVGPAGIASVTNQFTKDSRKYALALAGFGKDLQGGMSVGERYLRGLDAIDQKRVKVDDADVHGITGTAYSLIGDEGDVQGLFTSPDSADAAVEIARGLYGYGLLNGDGDMTSAVEQAVGGKVISYRGKKTLVPLGVESGVFSSDIENLVGAHAQTLEKSKKWFYANGLAFTGDELSTQLRKLKLKVESTNDDGSITYSLIYGSSPVVDDDGRLYTFDLSKDMVEKQVKRRKSATVLDDDYFGVLEAPTTEPKNAYEGDYHGDD